MPVAYWFSSRLLMHGLKQRRFLLAPVTPINTQELNRRSHWFQVKLFTILASGTFDWLKDSSDSHIYGNEDQNLFISDYKYFNGGIHGG